MANAPVLTSYAEAPRRGGWTLRSALVRLAQPEPVRAGAVLELVRRTDRALHAHHATLEEVTAAAVREGRVAVDPELAPVVQAAAELDGLAEVLARWAHDRTGPPTLPPPVATVDDVAGRVFALLAEAGVPREGGRPRRG